MTMSAIDAGTAMPAAGRRSGQGKADVPDCLVAKFSTHKRLDANELAFLREIQQAETAIERRREIVVQGEKSPNLYVLKSGWAYSHKLLANGKRQVLEIFLPGDLIGVREYAFDGALNFVTTLTPTVVCAFPRSRLGDFYRNHPGLTAVLCDILMREQAILIERICDIGSRSAYQRIAHLFMEIYLRLERVGLRRSATFELPMSQTIIGEALGLSRVHVARTLRELRRARLLRVERGSATVLNERGLIEAGGFEEFHLVGR